ncbi:M56 family metallopeptidase, partial [Xanthovirga aplysinae]|uniref:M56 family metallopeptidase n=1 Tax=Xanthovirga aplysinae TaxID=2529853 RepID=UPI0012BB710E
MMGYMFEVAILIIICLVFYRLLLQKETFYRLNRWYFIFCLLLAFALPFVPVPKKFSWQGNTSLIKEMLTVSPNWVSKSFSNKEESSTEEVFKKKKNSARPQEGENLTKQIEPEEIKKGRKANTTGVTPKKGINPAMVFQWIFYLYLFGVVVFALNLLFQILVLVFKSYGKNVIVDGKYRIVELKGEKAPSSFGNSIFINPEKYDWDTYSQILAHEKIHVDQKHSLDLLLAELVLVFQWFNPFAWMYRKSLEHNLEYLTDSSLLVGRTVEKESYQLSLLKVSVPHFPLGVSTNYNQSFIKKRITMMNSKKSSPHSAGKYAFIIPVLTAMVFLFNEPSEGMIMTNDPVFASQLEPNGILEETAINVPADTGNESTIREEVKEEVNVEEPIMIKEQLKEVNKEVAKWDNNDFEVQSEYIESLKALGYDRLTLDELISLKNADVDADYIKSLQALGYKDLSLSELISAGHAGINAEYISSMQILGFKELSIRDLIRASHAD